MNVYFLRIIIPIIFFISGLLIENLVSKIFMFGFSLGYAFCWAWGIFYLPKKIGGTQK